MLEGRGSAMVNLKIHQKKTILNFLYRSYPPRVLFRLLILLLLLILSFHPSLHVILLFPVFLALENNESDVTGKKSKYMNLIHGLDIFGDTRVLAREFFSENELREGFCPTGFRNKPSRYKCLSQEKVTEIFEILEGKYRKRIPNSFKLDVRRVLAQMCNDLRKKG
ncbi:hypothetical protein SNEBB_006158 [Seison nebaliae]|nr:hypothetical protein SNEBB_006158 [Seison nebaliae]